MVVTAWERGVLQARDAAKHPSMHKTSPPPHNKGLFSDQVSVALKTRISGLNESVPSRILAHCGKAHISSKIVISSQNFHKNKRRILVHMYPYD